MIRPDGLYRSQQRFGMYRWHIMDPIRFEQDLRVTIQALGLATADGRYLPLQDDIASVAFWYQTRAARALPYPARSRGPGRALRRSGGWPAPSELRYSWGFAPARKGARE